jgi:hypothetical protein
MKFSFFVVSVLFLVKRFGEEMKTYAWGARDVVLFVRMMGYCEFSDREINHKGRKEHKGEASNFLLCGLCALCG